MFWQAKNACPTISQSFDDSRYYNIFAVRGGIVCCSTLSEPENNADLLRRRWRWRRWRWWRRRIRRACVAHSATTGAAAGRNRRGRSGRSTLAAQHDLIQHLRQSPSGLLGHRPLIDILLRQRHVLINANRLSVGQRNFLAPGKNVLDVDQSLDYIYISRVAIVFHIDVEGGAPYRDNRRRRTHAVVVGLAGKLLDMNLDVAEEDIQQFSPVTGVGAKNHPRVRVNLEDAAVGEFEYGAPVGSGDNHLTGFDPAADIERPGRRIAHDVDTTDQGNDGGGA